MGRATHLLTKTVTVAKQTAVSTSGDPTFGTQTTLKARHEKTTKVVLSTDGAERRADDVIITESVIDETDRVWLPGDDTGDNNAARRPLMVRNADIPSDGYTLFETFL